MFIANYWHSRKKDSIAIFLLLLITIIFSRVFVNFSILPKEDAAILMRYAEHFGKGSGLVWNIGEKPVDGATDFLFVILDGLLIRTGISVETSTRLIGYVSHLLTVVLVFLSIPRTRFINIFSAFLCAIFVAIGPGLYYVADAFGTTFFALFACITWYWGLRAIAGYENRKIQILFGLSALITGLIRPEGVIVTALMLLAITFGIGFKKARKLLLVYVLIFAFIGGIYFLWRWNYFAYPLPNPFYKKGGGYLHFDSAMVSFFFTLLFCLPVLPVFIFGLNTKEFRRISIGFTIIITGFAAAYLLISNEMNVRARFQYVLLPIAFMSGLYLISRLNIGSKLAELPVKKFEQFGRIVSIGFISLFYLAYPFFLNNLWEADIRQDGRYDIARILYDYRSRGYTIATPEAGLLPFYSKWNAVDTWGLNDQWIAHHKLITEDYLDQKKPEIIMYHEIILPGVNQAANDIWYQMTQILKNYAEKNGYILAASFGVVPTDTHNYYVRQDFKDSQEIIARIRNCQYAWYLTGGKTTNFAGK